MTAIHNQYSLHRFSLLLAALAVVLLTTFMLVPLVSASDQIDQFIEISDKGDITTAAEKLEKSFNIMKDDADISQQGSRGNELFRTGRILADLYARKLNKPDKALEIYRYLETQGKPGTPGAKYSLPLKLLIAEIYKRQGENQKAVANLTDFLSDLESILDREDDRDIGMMFGGIKEPVQYWIDDINEKNNTPNTERLLKSIKLPSLIGTASNPFLSMWTFNLFIPSINSLQTITPQELIQEINNNPDNLIEELTAFIHIQNIYASSTDRFMDQVLDTYLSKYPDTYYSLLLRAIFISFYKKEGLPAKAEKLIGQIRTICEKKNIEFIPGPDQRFASPENTWSIYQQALIDGDLELAMECHLPGEKDYRKFFTALGPEKMRTIAEDMQPIEKIYMRDGRSEYVITREMNGQDISFPIIFVQINGEWKIQNY